ncbi:two-component system response regulator ArlR [Breznakia sp. PF5-3]|uniref:response regulator transcription factor n=1 Tax=unclassified Breznakia TaxID=2623764 RepID=UPI0024071F07|nr:MULTISPECIES: response regulator transcription factor [unclassified Breznakia]MDF9824006.1 two-component system response regulator ArlR [Breznakia sp. PM6-1]MDF9834805.1 two-component system response regulator ArlR [Breznakia sp. PF5-3]MDF9838124.1 two-component system response regulator ArlR [Breznakia sp. PFB2-8]MDF9860110.1 two-component system response regulator ArlR [Breznakia sp. PH5-24]
MAKILIVEDEKNMLDLLRLELTHEHYEVDCAQTGRDALDKALVNEYDLILLDLMLPQMNGVEVCRRIRLEKSTPIIMLTARDAVMDKVNGLASGADDYLAKPFAMEELFARIHALLRRSTQTLSNINYRDLVLHIDAFQVWKKDQEILLTVKEFQLLKLFMKHPRKVFHRDELIEEIWGYENDAETNVVDVYIRHLRNKLESDNDTYIHTVRGVGYRFE